MGKRKRTVTANGRRIVEDTARGIAEGFTALELRQAKVKYHRVHRESRKPLDTPGTTQ